MFKDDKKKKADKKENMVNKKTEDTRISEAPVVSEKENIQPAPSNAPTILNQAVKEMEGRGETYDIPGGERSMEKTVKLFETLTGITMSEEQGWKFMSCLKLVRSETGIKKQKDDYVDGAAYFALAGEAALKK